MASIRKTKKRLKKLRSKEQKKVVDMLVKHPELRNIWGFQILSVPINVINHTLKELKTLKQNINETYRKS